MVRWAGSNTGCPNHVNWPLNPNPSGVSRGCAVPPSCSEIEIERER